MRWTELGGAFRERSVAGGALEEAIEAGAADAENLRGADTIAVAHFEHALDVNFADLIERQWAPVFIRDSRNTPLRFLEMLGQITDVDKIGVGRDGSAGNHVFELANIARPIMLKKDDLRAARRSLKRLVIGFAVFFCKVLNEDGNVFGVLGQTRDSNFNGVEAIEKIFAKASGEDFGAEIAICGCDEADVDMLYFRRTDPLNFAILNYAEKLGLHGERCFADFIEKYCSLVGVFKEALARSVAPVNEPRTWPKS